MNKTPGKSPSKRPKNAGQELDSRGPIDANVPNKPPRPVHEGNENLRQRAEWFRRRTGGED